MRRSIILAIPAIACGSTLTAQGADAGVKIFGSVDNGLTWVSNQGGHSHFGPQDGVNKSNSLGFMGSEDLGGGRSVIFKLEGGFSINKGGSLQGGLLFGKQSWLGLNDNQLGQLTVGRQYDFTTLLARFLPCMQCGLYIVQNADLDRVSGQRFNNSVQYQSARISGLKFGAMYAFPEGARNDAGRGNSFTLDYQNGPFSAEIVTTELKGAAILAGKLGSTSLLGRALNDNSVLFVDRQRIAAFGVAYRIDKLTPKLLYTNTRLELDGRAATDRMLHVGADYQLTPAVLLQAKYSIDRLEQSRWNMVNLGVDYMLTKRTDLYAEIAHQRASGPGTRASIPLTAAPSSSDQQTVTRIGILHLF